MASLERTYSKTEFMFIVLRKQPSTLSESLELSIDNVPIKQLSSAFFRQVYYITSTMQWYNPISITVVFSGKPLSEK